MESKLNITEKSKQVLQNIIKLQLFYFFTVTITYLLRNSILVDVVFLLVLTITLVVISVCATYAYLNMISKRGEKLVERINVFIMIQVPSSLVFAFTMIVFLGTRVIYD